MRWEGGMFFILFKNGEHRASLRFYLFVYTVNQGNKGDALKIFLRPRSDGKTVL